MKSKKAINDLKNGYNVVFTLETEDQAATFIEVNNYWTKLVRYVQCFNVNESEPKKGKPSNLDFCYLKDMSSIDMHFRKALISLSLDVEHSLKTKMLNHMSNNDDFDEQLFLSTLRATFSNGFRNMLKHAKTSNYSSDIAYRYIKSKKKRFHTIVELFSFGELVKSAELYMNKYPDFLSELEHLLLFNSKMLRNAAAHNNAILITLNPMFRKTISDRDEIIKIIRTLKLPSRLRTRIHKYQLFVDFICLLRAANIFCSPAIKKVRIEELKDLFDNRCTRNSDYYTRHEHIPLFFKDMSNLVDICFD